MYVSPDLPSPTLAEKVDLLFRTFRPRGGGEYSFEEVAQKIAESGGPTISATYLWMLRKGIRDNPTKKHLEALANFFKVSPEYFFDSETAQRYAAQLDLVGAFRDAGVREIALRAQDLSPEALQTIAEMLDRVRKLEGLPDARDTTKTGEPEA